MGAARTTWLTAAGLGSAARLIAAGLGGTAWSIATGLGAAAAFGFARGMANFPLDDAWIHLAYAKSLQLGDGFSYNPGDHATGFSSPLWVLCLAMLPIQRWPVISVLVLGGVLHALLCGLVAYAARLDWSGWLTGTRSPRATPARARPWVALTAGGLVALCPWLLRSAASGMEVSLTACLLIAFTTTLATGRVAGAAVLAALCTWARPESLVYTASLSVLCAAHARNVRLLLPAACGPGAMLAWMLYCWLATGYPLPNTFYVKAETTDPTAGLAYLLLRVLPQSPWLLGLGGLPLLWSAVRRVDRPTGRFVLLGLGALALTHAAIVLTRPLRPEVLFFQSRYFAILAPLPILLVARGIPGYRPWLAGLWIAPIALLTALGLAPERARHVAQTREIQRVHTNVARHVRASLPVSVVIAVEGAGAVRFELDRRATVIDLLGLNDVSIAHAKDGVERLCLVLKAGTSHLAIPTHMVAGLEGFLRLRPLASFVARGAQTTMRVQSQVILLALDGVQPRYATACNRPVARSHASDPAGSAYGAWPGAAVAVPGPAIPRTAACSRNASSSAERVGACR